MCGIYLPEAVLGSLYSLHDDALGPGGVGRRAWTGLRLPADSLQPDCSAVGVFARSSTFIWYRNKLPSTGGVSVSKPDRAQTPGQTGLHHAQAEQRRSGPRAPGPVLSPSSAYG